MSTRTRSSSINNNTLCTVMMMVVVATLFMLLFSWYGGASNDHYQDDVQENLYKIVKKNYFRQDDYDGSGNRDFAIHKLIQLACQLFNKGKLIDVEISTEDRGTDRLGVYTFCYPEDRPELARYCGPDWSCYWWKDANISNFLETAKILEKVGKKKPATTKAGWVGNISSPLSDVPEFHTRPLLYKIAKQNPQIMEAIHVSPVNNIIDKETKNYLTLGEQVARYSYLIDIGGNGYSGRLKYLLWTGRPLLIVKRKYIEYFHADLIPYHHFIPVKEDLSDLVVQIEWCRLYPEKTAMIAVNALEFARKKFSLHNILRDVFHTLTLCAQYKKSSERK